MFIPASFITVPDWKPPKCPSTGEWVKKLEYIAQQGEQTIVTLSNTNDSHRHTTEGKKTDVNERMHIYRHTHCVIPFIWSSKQVSIQERHYPCRAARDWKGTWGASWNAGHFLVFIWGVCVMGVFTWWKIHHCRLCTLCVCTYIC